jgi:hypothetical protein
MGAFGGGGVGRGEGNQATAHPWIFWRNQIKRGNTPKIKSIIKSILIA